MQTAVIIPSVIDRQSMLSRCLASIEAATEPPDAVVVMYQGREDPIATRALRAVHPDVEVRWTHTPGASAARNAGVRAVSAALLLFVDDDCVVDSDWVRCYRDAFADDPRLMAAGGQVLPMGASETQGAPLGLKTAEKPQLYEGRQNPIGTVDRGGNLAVRMSAYAAVGGFDERLGPGTFVKSGEDVDLAYRLLRVGNRLRYIPDAVVYHDQWRTADEAVTVERGYGLGMGAFLGIQLRQGDFYAGWLVLWVIGQWAVRPILSGLIRRRGAETRHGLLHLFAIPRGLWFALVRLPAVPPAVGLAIAAAEVAIKV